MNYKDIIYEYQAINEQEKKDLKLMKQFIEAHDDALLRSNLIGHITSSVIIINTAKTKILMGFHNIYRSWGWFGGHNDGDPDCLNVALKEAKEETGLKNFTRACEKPIGIDVIYVANHIKHDDIVPDHLHLNITYGLIADDAETLSFNEQEHQGIAWFDLEDYLNHVKEPRMKPVYKKIVQRILACVEE
jgi:8-oxo-dGTP pyrophosphatase MutT (NUDIX family)